MEESGRKNGFTATMTDQETNSMRINLRLEAFGSLLCSELNQQLTRGAIASGV